MSNAIRLGAPVCVKHKWRCGRTVDEHGLHQQIRKYSAGRSIRHSKFSNILQSTWIGPFPFVLELPGYVRAGGKRSDGLTLVPWNERESMVWDSMQVHTMADTYIGQINHSPGKATEIAERKKICKCVLFKGRYSSTAIGVESFGTWGPTANSFYRTG